MLVAFGDKKFFQPNFGDVALHGAKTFLGLRSANISLLRSASKRLGNKL